MAKCRNNYARIDRNCSKIRTRNSYTKNTVNIDIDKTGDRPPKKKSDR
ncbi:hypothetical protein [Okeania sp. KiyG1]|nr:hypothetical protein [Okeania sp. KiyG1]